MRRPFRIAYGLLLLLPICLSAQKNIYLNPDNAIGAKSSLFFSAVDLIPLETSKACSFTNMSGFLVTPRYYVVLDGGNNRVLLFDRQGKFRHAYTRKRFKLATIQYIPSKDAIFITSRNKNYTIPQGRAQKMMQEAGDQTDFSKYTGLDLLYLNSEPAFRTESLPVPRFALNGLYYFNDHYLVNIERYNKYLKDSVGYHLLETRGNQVVRRFFPFLNIEKLPPYYEGMEISFDPDQQEGALLLHKNYDNTVYRLTKDSLSVAYRFIFPATHTMPADFQSTLFKNNIEYTNYTKKNGKAIDGFYNMIPFRNLFFFSTSDNNRGGHSYLFNDRNNMLYDRSKINTDSTIYFLPNSIFSRIMEFDDQYLYSAISTADLLKEKANMLEKNEVLPAPIRKLLEGLDKYDNQVIIQLKVNSTDL
ncbi:hypothetical protein GCM10027051_17730 [Niabella terrae]